MTTWFSSESVAMVTLPLLIFTARVIDVGIGTVRTVFIMRGWKGLAALLGFVEILIWAAAIGQLMQNLNNIFCYIAFAGGFATGNYVGIFLEEKLALGFVALRIITNKEDIELLNYLKNSKYGVTQVEARGKEGKVSIIFMILKRSELKKVLSAVHQYHPNAFYSIEDVRSASQGGIPFAVANKRHRLFDPLRSLRQGK